LTQSDQIRQDNTSGEDHIFRGSAAPIPQGGGAPALPNFWSSLIFMHILFDAEIPNLRRQHILGGDFSRGSVMGLGPSDPKFCWFLSIYAYSLCRWTTKFEVVTHIGRRLVFSGQPRPHPKGAVPKRSQFWWFPSFYAYSLWCRTTKFDVAKHRWGGRLFLVVSHAPTPRGRGSSAPQILEFSCSLHTPFNAEWPNSCFSTCKNLFFFLMRELMEVVINLQ